MDRLRVIASHFRDVGDRETALVGGPRPSDVVICCAIRTPLTKAKRGPLSRTPPEALLAPLFSEVIRRTGLNPELVDDICIGNVLQPGAGALSSRMAALLGGLPVTTGLSTVNRQCSSGLQAVANVVSAIQSGVIQVGIGGGVESMSMFDMMDVLNPSNISDAVFEHEAARNCLIPMGMTSENVASSFGVSRQAQDRFAVESHLKAAKAQTNGWFREETVPVDVSLESGSIKKDVTVREDDGIRPQANMKDMAKLKPAFKADGTTTAANSSQVTDGAALVLLAKRSVATKHNLPILAKVVSVAVVGVPPDIMGIGPMFAIPRAVEKAGLTIDDVDIFELNEAFASQAVLCAEQLKIPAHKLNPKGGAIALGHPLGATGARQIATLLPELRRTKGRFGVVSMCIGTGMGAAAVIENLA